MTVESKLDFNRYLSLMYLLTYRRAIIISLTTCGCISLIGSILYIHKYNVSDYTLPFLYLAFGLFIIVIFPAVIYWNARRNFFSHSRLQEKIMYEFSDQKIKIIGETFNSEMDWTKTYKILELKRWILIYHNRIIANIIPKESFGTNLNDFRNLVMSKSIKFKLIKL
jgi:hypothetical protein